MLPRARKLLITCEQNKGTTVKTKYITQWWLDDIWICLIKVILISVCWPMSHFVKELVLKLFPAFPTSCTVLNLNPAVLWNIVMIFMSTLWINCSFQLVQTCKNPKSEGWHLLKYDTLGTSSNQPVLRGTLVNRCFSLQQISCRSHLITLKCYIVDK